MALLGIAALGIGLPAAAAGLLVFGMAAIGAVMTRALVSHIQGKTGWTLKMKSGLEKLAYDLNMYGSFIGEYTLRVPDPDDYSDAEYYDNPAMKAYDDVFSFPEKIAKNIFSTVKTEAKTDMAEQYQTRLAQSKAQDGDDLTPIKPSSPSPNA